MTPGAGATPGAGVPAPWPSGRQAWYAVGILTLAYTVAFIDRQILNLLVDPLRRDLALSDTMVSLLQGPAFAVFYSVLGVPIARLADRGNRRNIIVVGMVLWCVATALCGLSQTFLHLFIARMLVGVGEAALSPPAYSIIADYFPPSRLARATGVYSLGVYSGAGIALLVGGAAIAAISEAGPLSLPILGELRPWQLAFIVVGLPGLAVAALMMTVKEPLRRGSAQAAAGPVVRASWADLLAFLGRERRVMIALCVGFCCLGIVMIGVLSWGPVFLMRVHGWTVAQVGTAYGLVLLLFGTTGSFAGGWLADRQHARGVAHPALRTAIPISLAALPFLLLLPWAPSGAVALALLVPVSFLLASPVGLSAAAIQVITPNELRGQVTALYLLVVALVGSGFGPMAVALCTDFLFADPLAVGKSLAVVSACLIPLGTLALWIGIRAAPGAAARRAS